MLAESTKQATPEVIAEEVVAEETTAEEVTPEVVAEETKPAKKERTIKEDSQVSSQVAALLEAEGLSEEFKLQAVTIFEAAVTDRVIQIQEELEAEYEEKLDEAKAELEINIDGFLNEAVQEWADNNQVAIESNFKTRLAESFMDGLQSLLAEHNIDLPDESEDALEIALDEVNKLEEQVSSVDEVIAEMQEEINTLKAEKILESFSAKMTSTEFDRFVQLTESVKFKDESQYEKQLSIVLENFGKITAKKVEQEEQIVEETVDAPAAQPIITETFSAVNRYAQYLAKKPA
jgi:heme-degrading monooxygenase HmoA